MTKFFASVLALFAVSAAVSSPSAAPPAQAAVSLAYAAALDAAPPAPVPPSTATPAAKPAAVAAPPPRVAPVQYYYCGPQGCSPVRRGRFGRR